MSNVLLTLAPVVPAEPLSLDGPLDADLLEALNMARFQATMAEGVVQSFRQKLGANLIWHYLTGLRSDPNPIAKISPVIHELNVLADPATPPGSSCAHAATVNFANRVCLSVHLAELFPHLRNDPFKGDWPDADILIAACKREASRAQLARGKARPGTSTPAVGDSQFVPLLSWRDIVMAIKKKNPGLTGKLPDLIDTVRKLHIRFRDTSPIRTGKPGGQPTANEPDLLRWWESIQLRLTQAG